MNVCREIYNEIEPFFIELDKTYDVYPYNDSYRGYGFTVDISKDLYISVDIWNKEKISVKLKRRTTKFFTDVVNDYELIGNNEIKNLKELKPVVFEYLGYAKTMEKVYKVELTSTELNNLISLANGELKEKLQNYLQEK
jgi:hypothetical protein